MFNYTAEKQTNNGLGYPEYKLNESTNSGIFLINSDTVFPKVQSVYWKVKKVSQTNYLISKIFSYYWSQIGF